MRVTTGLKTILLRFITILSSFSSRRKETADHVEIPGRKDFEQEAGLWLKRTGTIVSREDQEAYEEDVETCEPEKRLQLLGVLRLAAIGLPI